MKVLVFLLLLASIPLSGAVIPHPLFTDHAVLLRSEATPVFGFANPGEVVEVSLDRIKASAVADNSGKWLVTLDLSYCTSGPFTLKMNAATASDVMVGSVWLCTGGGNMQFTLRNDSNGTAEIAASNHPQLRSFTVGRNAADTAAEKVQGRWQVSSPATAGGFSAIAYYFGSELLKERKEPVGLIDSSWIGTVLEAWVSREKLAGLPAQKKNIETIEHEYASYDENVRRYINNFLNWQRKAGRSESDCKLSASYDWRKFTAPGTIPGEGGIALVRREVELPAHMAGKPLSLFSGKLNAPAEVTWNGEHIGSISLAETAMTENHRLTIPAHIAKQGKNELLIRFFSPVSGIQLGEGCNVAGRIPLAGRWEYAWLFEFPPLPPKEKEELPLPPPLRLRPYNLPGRIYNAMIQPLMPCGLSGIILYQGEHNLSRPNLYREAFVALIEEYREGFGSEVPFYFFQLPNLHAKLDNPNEYSALAAIREAQRKVLELPGTGMIVLADTGEAGYIYPRDKREAGQRLALAVLNNTYSPLFRSFRVEGSRVRVYFDHAKGGLAAKEIPARYLVSSARNLTAPLIRNSPESQLEGFAIAGADGVFHWADAKIESDTVILSSPQVPSPTMVRFGWTGNPTINLYSQTGLPASPFQDSSVGGKASH